ncbi:MAG: hypothetical protein MRJ93_12375 [Nitrososphaeraceae archaeon]|nr:hypothetical protein [Nitrososphaeraceae archaeon]
MKLYKKLTIINASLGLTIAIIFLSSYFLVNSFIGIPILGLFLGNVLVHVLIILAINIAGLVVIFYIKNEQFIGLSLIGCGVLILFSLTYIGIPSFILFIIAGILALRGKNNNRDIERSKVE